MKNGLDRDLLRVCGASPKRYVTKCRGNQSLDMNFPQGKILENSQPCDRVTV